MDISGSPCELTVVVLVIAILPDSVFAPYPVPGQKNKFSGVVSVVVILLVQGGTIINLRY